MRKLFLLLLSAGIILFISCGGDSSSDFGNPPTPESCFCDPDGIAVYLQWVAENYPDIAERRVIGYTEENRPIYALEISDNPGESEEEPSFLMNGSIHGNEQLSGGVVLKMIEYLVKASEGGAGYSLEETDLALYIIENIKMHFIPAVNPDGLDNGSRYNSNLVDLNRNFGYNWDESEANNGDSAFDQSESAAVRDDFLEKGYMLALNLHTATSTYNTGIYAPWDAIATLDYTSSEEEFTETYLPNYPLLKELGGLYADSVVDYGNYLFENFHYQEGADWYVMYGSMADWALGELGAVSYTVELIGEQNFTTADSYQLNEAFGANREAVLELVLQAENGCGGRLIIPGGTPFSGAEITLAPLSGGRAFTPVPYPALKGKTNADGLFRFLTQAGSYHITVTADGYQTVDMDIIVNSSGETSTDGGSNYESFPEYILSP